MYDSNSSNMKILETKRCILRPATLNDSKDLFDYYKEDIVVKYLPFKKHKSIKDTERFIKLFFFKNYKEGKIGHYLIVLKRENKVIGNVGFNNILPNAEEGEMGICINPNYWGEHLSTELAAEMLRYGFEDLNLKKIIAITFEDNKYSRKPLEVLGFNYLGKFKKKFPSNKLGSYTVCHKYQMLKSNYIIKEWFYLCENINDNWISKNLRYAIANSCSKDPYKITKDFLKTLTEIDLSDSRIDDLTGIQYAINLSSINLNKNEITDANLLSKLTRLNNLELSENRIEDISFLTNLKRLKSIGLDSNNISNVPNLDKLRYLNLINISDNKISDLSFIDTLYRKNVKVIASEQLLLLDSILIESGEDITFKTPIRWNKETEVLFDNIQVTGKYNNIKTNKRPSLLYSISEILIKNICSDCLIKAEFYHEVLFSKSGTLSGILIQPILIKNK